MITNDLVLKQAQTNTVLFDKKGDLHYDIASAFIKSIRGSDPNAAVYWLARLIEGGEEVKFIARRLIIAASEDIGNANPTALVLANTTFQSVQAIGMPEARIILSQCYLSGLQPKSNAAYSQSIKFTNSKRNRNLPVPLHLRNAPTQLMKELDYGKGYLYAHDYPNNFVQQAYLPQEIQGTCFINPVETQKKNSLNAF